MFVMRRNTVAFLQSLIICILFLAGTTEYSYSQDIYEPDDTYLQASVIIPDFEDGQEHTFHDATDKDWVKFYALAGKSYMFLHSWSSGIGYIMLFGPNKDTFVAYTINSDLTWQCPADKQGMYYVQLFTHPDDPVTNYSIQVRTYFGLGLPVYLTGQIKNSCNQPVPNARIKVSGPDTNSGVSLPNGAFITSLKLSGTYTVTIYADNHQSLVQNTYAPGNRTFWMTRLSNNPPVARDDMVRCAASKSVSGNVLGNDYDPDGDAIHAVLDSNVKNGSLVFTSTGAFTYKHNGGSSISDSFTYHVSDGCLISKTVKVTINPTPLPFLMLLMK